MKLRGLILLLLLPAAAAFAQDNTAPTIVSWDFTPKAIDVTAGAQSTVVTLFATDDIAGIDQVSVHFRSPSGRQGIAGGAQTPFAGSKLNGEYRFNVAFDNEDEAGLWKIDLVRAADEVGNVRELRPPLPGPTELQVTTAPKVDTTSPTLLSFELLTDAIDTSAADQVVPFRITATDGDGSGLRSASAFMFLMTPAGVKIQRVGENIQFAPGRTDQFEGIFKFPRYSQAGIWRVSLVVLRDNAGNFKFFFNPDDPPVPPGGGFPDFQNILLNVTSDPTDFDAPNILSLDFTPAGVDLTQGAATIIATAHMTDLLAGTSSVDVDVYNPAGGQERWIFLYRRNWPDSGTDNDGRLAGWIDFPVNSAAGVWKVKKIVARDKVRNERTWTQAELEANGINTSLQLSVGLKAHNAAGFRGGIATLTAQVTRGGTGLAGQTVLFALSGTPVGEAVTDATGVATLTGVTVADYAAGFFWEVITAQVIDAETGNTIAGKASLTVHRANQTITFDPIGPKTQNDEFTVSATASSGLPVTFSIWSGPAYIIGGNRVYIYGSSDVTVRAVQYGNDDYNFAEARQVVTVRPNTPPYATPQTLSIDEDSSVEVTLSGGDADGHQISYTQPRGPANGTLTSLGGNSYTYIPKANWNGTDSFSFQTFDGLSYSPVTVVSIEVRPVNDPPVVNAGPDTSGTEGTMIWFSGTVSDPDAADTHTISWTFGDGGALNGLLRPNHGYSDNGIFVVTLTVVDSGGVVVSDTLEVTVANVAPSVTMSGNPTNVVEGAPVTMTGYATDPGADTLTYSWSVLKNGAPFASSTAESITFTPDDNGTYSMMFTATDDDGGSNTVQQTLNASNAGPVLGPVSVEPTVQEGGSVTLTGTFADPGTADLHALTITWGDGVTDNITLAPGARSFSVTHGYPDDNPTGTASDPAPIGLTVQDDDGAAASTGTGTTIINVAPVVSSFTGPLTPLPISSTAEVIATFSDAGVLDTQTCTFSWDDGTTTTVSPAGGQCSATHLYSLAGVYSVGLTVTDDDLGVATSVFEFVVIFDSSAGFVTGNGKVISPAGAYVPDPTISGKAKLGFTAKYQTGNFPTGKTDFQLREANFSFESIAYEWMVISGARGQYRGTGMVNGLTGYTFMVTVEDGDQIGSTDKFRIKIWDTATSLVVYDNSPGSPDDMDQAILQPTEGGNIVVHGN